MVELGGRTAQRILLVVVVVEQVQSVCLLGFNMVEKVEQDKFLPLTEHENSMLVEVAVDVMVVSLEVSVVLVAVEMGEYLFLQLTELQTRVGAVEEILQVAQVVQE
jgi:hypothetical protein